MARNRKSDELGNEIDVIVYGEFDDELELNAYKAHDLYQESIRQVRPAPGAAFRGRLQHGCRARRCSG